jgi:hypothetical protein
MKKKIIIIPGLAIITTVIWLVNINLLASIRSKGEDSSGQPDSLPSFDENLQTAREVVSFKPVSRDPFNVVIDTAAREPAMPKLSLRGVVLTNKGAIALMELPDGSTSTMKKGDSYRGVRIEDITPREVIAYFGKHKFVFSIWK